MQQIDPKKAQPLQIRKDLRVAWNLLFLLTPVATKKEHYRQLIYETWGLVVTESSFRAIVAALSNSELIKTYKGRGIAWNPNLKEVRFSEVMRALGVGFPHSTDNPAGQLQAKLFSIMSSEKVLKP